MNEESFIISKGSLKKDCLHGDVAIVTGAGRGIGFETARSLAWLGASVIIAEIDKRTGAAAEEKINSELGRIAAVFIRTDLASEKSIKNLASRVMKQFGKAEIVINNATRLAIGAVQDVSPADWDACYQVNLKGPVMLVKEFLPGMIKRGRGTIVCVSSSGAAPFMGAYEVYKTAQVELANTLSLELEGTGVSAFTIGPGLVKTPGALESIEKIALLLGQTVEEFFEIGKDWLVSAEAAGAGFAAAAALSDRFNGQEISSRAALIEAGIDIDAIENETEAAAGSKKGFGEMKSSAGTGNAAAILVNRADADAVFAKTADDSAQTVKTGASQAENFSALCSSARETLASLFESWKKMNNFMKQWVLRDFKKQTGFSIEEAISSFDELKKAVDNNDAALAARFKSLPAVLAGYYCNYLKQAEGYIKDAEVKKEQMRLISSWQHEAEALEQAVIKQLKNN